MKRGRANPAAYSFTEKPWGTLICAPAGRGTMVAGFDIGGACASITAARQARARNDFMRTGLLFYTRSSLVVLPWYASIRPRLYAALLVLIASPGRSPAT